MAGKTGEPMCDLRNLLDPGSTGRKTLPLYRQIGDAIADRIETGKLAVGARMPTDIELAEQLGTSPVTVAKAYRNLSDGGLIVRQKKRGTYVKNARRRYGKFLFIAPDVGTFYIDAIIAGVNSVLKDRYDLVIRTHPHGEQDDHIGKELDRQDGVDGVLTIGAGEESCRNAVERGIRVVAMGYVNPVVPYVIADDIAVGRLAARFLIERGSTSLGVIGVSVYSNGRDRILGFQTAAEQAGFNVPENRVLYIRQPKRYVLSEEELDVLFGWTPMSNGLFVYNDALAIQVYLEAVKRGLRIPEDLRLIGVDNYRWLYRGLNLVSIDLNLRQVGWEGASLLVKMVEEGFVFKPGQERVIRVEPTLAAEDH
jgi:GntR family transcriptional regulator of arabinose operon